ncbi:GNAT family N-acetyltransferase [Pedobacter sp. Hv1]|uniref:GNAT family N-acetyltransferase n=1 Tax=Pedobacter sp. Hv1 TaxID=1740090 RepID=UPI0009E97D7A|nr:GNAT family N-acetyltransferase [Pedobacter sp. Hv1]
MKYNFKNDYTKGCHPNILTALAESNFTVEEGYGADTYSLAAAKLITDKMEHPSAAVYFVSGGTQANLLVISALLRPYESVIAAETAHIQVHETGAIEATGHRIQTVNTADGKLRVQDIQDKLDLFEEVHTTMPRMVYISNSTEVGTFYTKDELKALSAYCKEKGLLLFLDGARLASGLMAKNSGLTLKDLGVYTDVFYIGGTKTGALLGEAIVINNQSLQQNFKYNIKQRGALLAKGRLLGIQFLELFKDDLFFKLGDHANQAAQKLHQGIKALGYAFLTETQTNQSFPIFPNEVIAKINQDYAFYVWKKIDDQFSAVRLVTCWATDFNAVDEFIKDLTLVTPPVKDKEKNALSGAIEIVDYQPKYNASFRALNEEWISNYFKMEAKDYESLDQPEAYILAKGGHIKVALFNNEPVGVCALIKLTNHAYDYELAKMAVSPKVQGKNIGYLLGQAIVEKAKSLGATTLYLESNTILKPAINLYHKLGFERVEGHTSPYERSDIQMLLHLK